MQCPRCTLRYNSSPRQPQLLPCGHSICKSCQPKTSICTIDNCGGPTHTSKINYPMMEAIKKQTKNVDKYVKVCFVGSSGVGKTSLISMIMGQQYVNQMSPTIGYDFCFKDRKVDGFVVRYQLWDSAGQERYKAISPIHYKNAQILVLVYDINGSPQQNRVSYWLSQADKHCQTKPHVIIVGNKLDLVQGKMTKPIQPEVWSAVQDNQFKHVEMSCRCQVNLQQLWSELEGVVKLNIGKKKQQKLGLEEDFDDERKFPVSLIRERRSILDRIKTECC